MEEFHQWVELLGSENIILEGEGLTELTSDEDSSSVFPPILSESSEKGKQNLANNTDNTLSIHLDSLSTGEPVDNNQPLRLSDIQTKEPESEIEQSEITPPPTKRANNASENPIPLYMPPIHPLDVVTKPIYKDARTSTFTDQPNAFLKDILECSLYSYLKVVNMQPKDIRADTKVRRWRKEYSEIMNCNYVQVSGGEKNGSSPSNHLFQSYLTLFTEFLFEECQCNVAEMIGKYIQATPFLAPDCKNILGKDFVLVQGDKTPRLSCFLSRCPAGHEQFDKLYNELMEDGNSMQKKGPQRDYSFLDFFVMTRSPEGLDRVPLDVNYKIGTAVIVEYQSRISLGYIALERMVGIPKINMLIPSLSNGLKRVGDKGEESYKVQIYALGTIVPHLRQYENMLTIAHQSPSKRSGLINRMIYNDFFGLEHLFSMNKINQSLFNKLKTDSDKKAIKEYLDKGVQDNTINGTLAEALYYAIYIIFSNYFKHSFNELQLKSIFKLLAFYYIYTQNKTKVCPRNINSLSNEELPLRNNGVIISPDLKDSIPAGYPTIQFIHGPPGTGKTSTIVGFIYGILSIEKLIRRQEISTRKKEQVETEKRHKQMFDEILNKKRNIRVSQDIDIMDRLTPPKEKNKINYMLNKPIIKEDIQNSYNTRILILTQSNLALDELANRILIQQLEVTHNEEIKHVPALNMADISINSTHKRLSLKLRVLSNLKINLISPSVFDSIDKKNPNYNMKKILLDLNGGKETMPSLIRLGVFSQTAQEIQPFHINVLSRNLYTSKIGEIPLAFYIWVLKIVNVKKAQVTKLLDIQQLLLQNTSQPQANEQDSDLQMCLSSSDMEEEDPMRIQVDKEQMFKNADKFISQKLPMLRSKLSYENNIIDNLNNNISVLDNVLQEVNKDIIDLCLKHPADFDLGDMLQDYELNFNGETVKIKTTPQLIRNHIYLTANIVCCTLDSLNSTLVRRLEDIRVEKTDISGNTRMVTRNKRIDVISADALSSCQFNCIIIDEAGVLLETTSLLGLAIRAPLLIIAGDPLQTPPLTRSKRVQTRNNIDETNGVCELYGMCYMERALNKMNSELNTFAIHFLSTQYRMNSAIADFPSKYIYSGRLLSPKSNDYSAFPNVISGIFGPYLFMNLIGNKSREMSDRSSIMNKSEAEFVVNLARLILDICPFLSGHIGIITPYTSQKNYIRSLWNNVCARHPYTTGKFFSFDRLNDFRGILANMDMSLNEYTFSRKISQNSIDIDTIDGYQGCEKRVIILSTVRDNSEGHIGFLSSIRRLNVSITRAKNSLIVIGDRKTLFNESKPRSIWNEFIQDFTKKGCLVNIDVQRLPDFINTVSKGAEASLGASRASPNCGDILQEKYKVRGLFAMRAAAGI